MTPLFTDADKDLLRALPSETRKAVVNMLARHRKGGMADAARAVRAVGDDAQYGTVRGIFRGVADVLQRNAETPLVLEPLPGGRVRISGDVVVDCHVCDGIGVIDGRRRCADPECPSHGEPFAYSLGGGWECSRRHGHAEREATRFVAPADLAAVVKPGPLADPEAFPWDEGDSRGGQ